MAGERPDYLDTRQQLFRAWYEKGVPYDAYLKASEPKHADRWRQHERFIVLTDAQRRLLGSFKYIIILAKKLKL